jgi:phosphoribosylformylglycinamidine synthase
MKIEDVKVCVLYIEGTNCEEESHWVFKRLGANSEKVHLKQLIGSDVNDDEKRSLLDYDIVMLPGGFSAGDYVRAGAILGARVKSAGYVTVSRYWPSSVYCLRSMVSCHPFHR